MSISMYGQVLIYINLQTVYKIEHIAELRNACKYNNTDKGEVSIQLLVTYSYCVHKNCLKVLL